MPEEAAQDSEQVTENVSVTEDGADDLGEHVVSFWKTLPGVLTAGAGVIVALSGLVTGLSQAGLIGKRAQATPQAIASPATTLTSSASPTAVESMISPVGLESSPAPQRRNPLVEYRVGQMSDGFAMVRSQPTTASQGLVKLPSGTQVMCGEALRDADPDNPRRWRFCPEYDGYVSVRLLVRADS